jgi:hypothetical protein
MAIIEHLKVRNDDVDGPQAGGRRQAESHEQRSE